MPKRTIGIIVFDGVLTSEVIGPAEVFASAGADGAFEGANVLLIGVEQQATVRTEEGIRIGVDATLADDLILDVLLVPGANQVAHLLEHQELAAWIHRHEEAAQWVGSLCAGAFVLGNAGVLAGKRATTWHGGEALLQEQFPAIQVVHDQPVVLDNRRITANGGLVSYRAALILLGRMSSPQHAWRVYTGLGMHRLGTWEEIEASIVQ